MNWLTAVAMTLSVAEASLGRPVECEHCGTAEPPLYAWHGDVWCRACIQNTPLEMTGSLADAPTARPEDATYSRPYRIA